ncbi:hypothetical protein DPX16_12538 [Anabarilius grahami]|uniref:Uncharacterized protein n=1 Tax=Anabarilius grahami TaxID=495550 RepID=A0A3N0XS63_ANAGA|nr:hypothetical protein DPX16_12538 [Anabarilius grahami]
MSQSLSTSSQYDPGSLMYSKFGALPIGVSSQSASVQSSLGVSTSSQSRPGTQLTTSSRFFSLCREVVALLLDYLLSLLAFWVCMSPASPNKYASVPMSSHQAVYSQPTSSSGARFGASTAFSSQGMTTTYSGSAQPQGTTSQFAPGSQSSYPSVSLSSPQGAASQSATVQSSRKLFTPTFTSSSGTQEKCSTPFTLQGSTTYGGSLKPQGTTSQFAPGSQSSYPSVSLSLPQGAASQSATVQSSRKQFTSSYGTLSGSSTPFTLQGSTTYGGSLQPQGTTSQFAPASPSSYNCNCASLSSPQEVASVSATVQTSRKQFTSTFTGSSGTQEGSSTPLNMQDSTTNGGSLQPQATTIQSSVSNVPVTGILSEVGSSFTNRPLKRRLNLPQVAKGRVSSRPDLTSHAQTTPSSSVVVSLPLPLNEPHAGSLTSLQGSSGSTTTDTASVSAQGESTSFPARLGISGLSTSDQSSPSSYLSSSQETSGAESAETTLHVFSQESTSYGSSSAPGATYASQGSPVPLSEGSGQSISPQGESSHSGLFHSQGTSSHNTPESYNKLSSSGSSQSTSDQSTPSLYSSSSQGSSGSLLEASGSSFQGEVAGLSSIVDWSTQSQTSSRNHLPSSLKVSSQSTNRQSSPSLYMVGQKNCSDSQSTGPAYPLDTQGSLSLSSLSTQTRGSASTSQGSSVPELSGSSGQLIPTQVQRGNYSGMSQSLSTSSRYAPGSLIYSKFGALPIGVSSQSASVQSSPGVSKSTQSRPVTQLTTSSRFFPVQGGSSSTSRLSLKPLGILGLYAPASPTKYASAPMSSHQAVYSQPSSSSGARFGASTAYSGSAQPQGTTSWFAPGSSSSYPSVSLSLPQGAASQSAAVQSSRKQFTSSSGTLSGSSTPFTRQGSTTYSGSLQPQGTSSQFAPGSQSSYPSVSLSLPQGAASQSAAVQSSRKQFTSSFGTLSGSSSPFTLQGSTTYGGSLQPQGTTSQFASASPSSYNCHCVSLPLPQGVASQPGQAFRSYSVSQSQKSQRRQPSQGIQTSGAAASQGSAPSQSSPIRSRFSSLSSAGGSSSGYSGQFVSAQGSSTSYGGFSHHSQSPTSKYTHAYAKLGSSPLTVSSQSTSDQRSNGLYISDSRRTQGLHAVAERPSRLSSSFSLPKQ